MSAESSSRAHGFALLAGAALALLLISTHPHVHGHDLPALVKELVEGRVHNGIVHGGMVVALVVLFAGFLGLADRAGAQQLSTRLALCATALGSVGWVMAATINGFVLPELASGARGTTAEELSWLEAPLRLCSDSSHVFAALGTTGVFAALVAWAVALWQRNRALAVASLVLGSAGCLAVLSGHLHMDLHAMIVIVVGFGGWSAWAGVWLVRARAQPPE
jgi:hypothetical protein